MTSNRQNTVVSPKYIRLVQQVMLYYTPYMSSICYNFIQSVHFFFSYFLTSDFKQVIHFTSESNEQ